MANSSNKQTSQEKSSKSDNEQTSKFDNKVESDRKLLLEQFVGNIDNLGLTEQNLKISSAEVFEDSSEYYLLLFPEGLAEIVKELEKQDDAKAIEDLASREDIHRTTDKIYQALENKILNRTQNEMRAFSSFYSNPKYTPLGFKTAWNTANEIWYFAGDNSTDFNYYTKRSLLSSVYIKSCLFYIQDESEGNSETKRFINDSLERIVSMGKTIGSLKQKIPKIENIPFLRLFS